MKTYNQGKLDEVDNLIKMFKNCQNKSLELVDVITLLQNEYEELLNKE